MTVDAGLVAQQPPPPGTGTIGDFVWSDRDLDGIQDLGEPGIPTVAISLLDTGGNAVATTSTDGDGFCSFTGHQAGSYVVRVDAPPGATTRPDAGTDESVESDVRPDHQTGAISLGAGETNDTMDAGYVDF